MNDWVNQATQERPYHLRTYLEVFHNRSFENTRNLTEQELVALIEELENE